LTSQLIHTIGLIGAVFTTLCSIPQAVKIIRDKETRAISLFSTLGLAIGGVFWMTYGIARVDWPLSASSGISLAVTLIILKLKLRYG
jgi:MtN3 and saliva related transmembrane protein